MDMLLYVAAFAAAYRLWGSDLKSGKRWAVGIALTTGFLLDGLAGLALGAAFCIVRWLPFKAFGGSATPITERQKIGLFLRHAMMVPPAMIIAMVSGGDIARSGVAMAAFAFAATALGAFYGEENEDAKAEGRPIDPGLNTCIELLCGAAFGVAAWVI